MIFGQNLIRKKALDGFRGFFSLQLDALCKCLVIKQGLLSRFDLAGDMTSEIVTYNQSINQFEKVVLLSPKQVKLLKNMPTVTAKKLLIVIPRRRKKQTLQASMD